MNQQVPAAPERALRQRQRQRLIDACITALHQFGPSRTTIDKVVSIAEMSPGIVNFYFETKAAMLVAALEHLGAEFEARVQAPLVAMRDDPARALPHVITLYLQSDIATPRKVSVWYAFWGEASSRQEYQQICGRRDAAFALLVRDLVASLIEKTGTHHVDADAIALGLLGVLEMFWQEIAYSEEAEFDRERALRRGHAYLASVFPATFGPSAPITPPPAYWAAPTRATAAASLIAAEITLAGLPAFALPDDFLGFSVAVRTACGTARVALRVIDAAAPQPDLPPKDSYTWLAIMTEEPGQSRRIFLLPQQSVLLLAQGGTLFTAAELAQIFPASENNFSLAPVALRTGA